MRTNRNIIGAAVAAAALCLVFPEPVLARPGDGNRQSRSSRGGGGGGGGQKISIGPSGGSSMRGPSRSASRGSLRGGNLSGSSSRSFGSPGRMTRSSGGSNFISASSRSGAPSFTPDINSSRRYQSSSRRSRDWDRYRDRDWDRRYDRRYRHRDRDWDDWDDDNYYISLGLGGASLYYSSGYGGYGGYGYGYPYSYGYPYGYGYSSPYSYYGYPYGYPYYNYYSGYSSYYMPGYW